jgi:uncharacterized protein YrrD
MLIYAKKIIGMNVLEGVSGTKVDVIKNIIVDPESGKILAFLVSKNFFWQANRVVSFRDVVEIFADGVLIKNLDSVVDAREIFKLKDILRKRIFLIGSLVMTQNGKKIGLLEDFLFDTMFQNILTLTVKKIFSAEKRIISSERILSILPRKVIIRDTILKASVQKKLGDLNRLLNTATNN